MKTCSKCNINKELEDYFVKDKKSGRLHAQCKSCYKEHRKTYYREHYANYREDYLERGRRRRKRLREVFRRNMLTYLKDKSCVICKENDIRVLELDHLDPLSKRFTISQAVRLGYNWSAVEEELKKCRVLCANCHKKHTAEQSGWYKSKFVEARTGIAPV